MTRSMKRQNQAHRSLATWEKYLESRMNRLARKTNRLMKQNKTSEAERTASHAMLIETRLLQQFTRLSA